MNYEAKIFDEGDFILVDKWSSARGFPSPNKEFLPKHGLLISADDKPVVMGFLFLTDANVAAIGHIMSDPESDREVRANCIDILLDVLCGRARQLGFGQVNCSTNIPKLMDKFENASFENVDKNVSTFRRFL